MRKNYIFIIIFLIIILVAGGVYYIIKTQKPSLPEKNDLSEEINRRETIKDISQNINEISPVNPVLGGEWYVNRFWFIEGSNKDFYVEYEDGHILRQILVKAEKKEGELDYEIIAVFEPGDTNWQLKQGEDKFFGAPLDLYEYNKETEEWTKKN